MKKAPFLLLLLIPFLAFTSVKAQDTAPQAIPKSALKITGTGQMRVTPDLAVVNMTVKATDMDFNNAVKKLNQKTSELNRKLLGAGFKKDEIKTSQLNVQENRHWRNGENIDSGYVANQHIELRFQRDYQRMSRLMEAFAKEEGAEALFHFGFALSDQARQQANEELIRKAIQDARAKATVIAKSSGVRLGKIRSISYGQPESRPVPMYAEMEQMSMRAQKQEGMPDLELREIEMQDTITILWEIE